MALFEVLFLVGGISAYTVLVVLFDRYLWRVLTQWVRPRKGVRLAFFAICAVLEGAPVVSICQFAFPPASGGGLEVGFWLMAFFLYFFLFVLLLSLLQALVGRLFSKREQLRKKGVQLGKVVGSALLSIGFCVYGFWALQNPVVTSFSAGQGEGRLRVVALSDLHYGTVGSKLDLEGMVGRINALSPDVVLFAGDVIDNAVEHLDQAAFAKAMRQLQSTYGVYAVGGNHEYIQNTSDALRAFYAGSGVTLLVDEAVEVAGRFRLAGRKDFVFGGLKGERTSLETLLSGSDPSLPLVVLDHQPQDHREAEAAGAVLQISGHTHGGQIWPGDLVVGALYALRYQCPINGQHTDGGFTLAVTRGYGAWGFQLRTTGRAELLCIDLAV